MEVPNVIWWASHESVEGELEDGCPVDCEGALDISWRSVSILEALPTLGTFRYEVIPEIAGLRLVESTEASLCSIFCNYPQRKGKKGELKKNTTYPTPIRADNLSQDVTRCCNECRLDSDICQL